MSLTASTRISSAGWQPTPMHDDEEPGPLPPERMSRLLDRVPATTALELRDRALFETAYGSGLRAEDLVRLDVTSIDFAGGWLRAAGSASNAYLVAAGEPALAALSRYLARARAALSRGPDEPALFLSKSGRRLSASDVRRRLRVWSRHAAMHGAMPADDPRHRFVAHLLAGGSDPRSIHELRDRASVTTMPTYTRVESARLKVAYARAHPRA